MNLFISRQYYRVGLRFSLSGRCVQCMEKIVISIELCTSFLQTRDDGSAWGGGEGGWGWGEWGGGEWVADESIERCIVGVTR